MTDSNNIHYAATTVYDMKEEAVQVINNSSSNTSQEKERSTRSRVLPFNGIIYTSNSYNGSSIAIYQRCHVCNYNKQFKSIKEAIEQAATMSM